MSSNESNQVDYLLNEIITKKVIPDLRNNNLIGKNNPLLLYFIYHLPRLRSFSYLLTNETLLGVESYKNSFSYQKIIQLKNINSKQLLNNDEFSEILCFSSKSIEVNDLLDNTSICSSFHYQSKIEKLSNIIRIFNELDVTRINELINKPDVFQIILKIALLSLPQMPVNSDYAYFDGKPNPGTLVLGTEKKARIENNIKDFLENKLVNNFTERLFLLLTLIEGFLWKTTDAENLQDFFVGNLFDILSKGNSRISKEAKQHAIYLKSFEYYFYGKYNTTKNEIEKKTKEIRKVIKDVLSDNLYYLIQFSKFFISNLNYGTIQANNELGNPIIPKSIAHGITSIFLPKNIGIYNESSDSLVLIEAYEFNNDAYDHIITSGKDILNSTWNLYKKKANSLVCNLSDFNNTDSIAINPEKRQLIVRTKNALNQQKTIMLEFFPMKDDDILSLLSNHVIDNFNEYKYSLKAFIDKQFYIHKSASLNSDTENWYYKAFCKLYMLADEQRLLKSPHVEYRKWENTYFKDKEKESELIIFDLGSGYGRLEKFFLTTKEIKDQIKTIYAIDSSQYLLDQIDLIKEIDDSSDNVISEKDFKKIKKIHGDFRTLDFLIPDSEKANYVLFIYTTFGYFKTEQENKEVLNKAFNILTQGGKLIIEQFNPKFKPEHCNIYPEIFDFNNEGRDYILVKTSTYKEPNEEEEYALYYGNYVYFDTTGDTEEMIKCDTYEIRLYTEEWFRKIKIDGVELGERCKFKYFKPDGFENNVPDFDNAKVPIMVVEISRSTSREDLKLINFKVYQQISGNTKFRDSAVFSNSLKNTKSKIDSIVDEKIDVTFKILDDILRSADNENILYEKYCNIS